jgi:TPR repeat protein
MVMWISFCCWSPLTWGGADEGFAAYQRGDYINAYRIWLPLAQRGDARAQGALGALYADGRGVPQDFIQAHVWLNLAAARLLPGAYQEKAAKARDRVTAQMTPAQIAEALRRARAWQPPPPRRTCQSIVN